MDCYRGVGRDHESASDAVVEVGPVSGGEDSGCLGDAGGGDGGSSGEGGIGGHGGDPPRPDAPLRPRGRDHRVLRHQEARQTAGLLLGETHTTR